MEVGGSIESRNDLVFMWRISFVLIESLAYLVGDAYKFVADNLDIGIFVCYIFSDPELGDACIGVWRLCLKIRQVFLDKQALKT